MPPLDSPTADHRPSPPGCRAPTADEQAGLRRLVGELAAVSSRRPPAVLLRVGRPAGISCDFLVRSPGTHDAALRADVVAALLREARRQAPAPTVCLLRAGTLQTEDADLAWYAAARAAYAEAGVPLLMAVTTRHGWYDPGTGRRREWKRLRLDRPRS